MSGGLSHRNLEAHAPVSRVVIFKERVLLLAEVGLADLLVAEKLAALV